MIGDNVGDSDAILIIDEAQDCYKDSRLWAWNYQIPKPEMIRRANLFSQRVRQCRYRSPGHISTDNPIIFFSAPAHILESPPENHYSKRITRCSNFIWFGKQRSHIQILPLRLILLRLPCSAVSYSNYKQMKIQRNKQNSYIFFSWFNLVANSI